jgi:hypothetical protein
MRPEAEASGYLISVGEERALAAQARSRFFAALRMTDRNTRATAEAKVEADSFASLRNDRQKNKGSDKSPIQGFLHCAALRSK